MLTEKTRSNSFITCYPQKQKKKNPKKILKPNPYVILFPWK